MCVLSLYQVPLAVTFKIEEVKYRLEMPTLCLCPDTPRRKKRHANYMNSDIDYRNALMNNVVSLVECKKLNMGCHMVTVC